MTGMVFASCEETATSFEVIEISATATGVARNEPVNVVFSSRVATDSPLRVIRVRRHDGSAVETQARVEGATVVLEAEDPLGWPPGDLELHVDRGHAGAFRSADGEGLAADYTAAFVVQPAFKDRGEPFRIERSSPGGVTGVRRDAVFEYRFTLPVDADSMRNGVRLSHYTRRGRLVWSRPVTRLSRDQRTLYVRPFTPDGAFGAGRRYQLHFLPELRAVTGRALDERHPPLAFETARAEADGYEGFADVSFAMSDIDPRDNPWMNTAGAASPTIERRPLVVGSRDIHPRDDQIAERPWMQWTWSEGSSRTQLLLRGRHLGEDAGWITGFSWLSVDPIPTGMIFPQVVIRIGLARSSELTTEFDQNFMGRLDGRAARDAVVRTAVHGATSAEWRPLPQAGWISVMFQTPFWYPGGGEDVVLEINNMQGGQPMKTPGLLWAATEEADRPGRAAVLLTGRSGYGTHGNLKNVVFATKIHFERYVDIVSRWYEADIPEPVWYELGIANDLDADGSRDRDFWFLFQGRRADGTLTDWIPCDDRLRGCPEVRVKVVWLEGVRPHDDEPPEVRRLRVRYRKAP